MSPKRAPGMSQDWMPYIIPDIQLTTRKKFCQVASSPEEQEWSGQTFSDALTWLIEVDKTAGKIITPGGLWSIHLIRPLTLEEKEKWHVQPLRS